MRGAGDQEQLLHRDHPESQRASQTMPSQKAMGKTTQVRIMREMYLALRIAGSALLGLGAPGVGTELFVPLAEGGLAELGADPGGLAEERVECGIEYGNVDSQTNVLVNGVVEDRHEPGDGLDELEGREFVCPAAGTPDFTVAEPILDHGYGDWLVVVDVLENLVEGGEVRELGVLLSFHL